MEISKSLIRYILMSTAKKKEGLPPEKRDVYKEIGRGINILWGLRGTGKTTLLLQHLKENDGLYLKMDHFLFSTHRLYEVVEYFYNRGVRRFYLDEIQTYEKWAQELKDIYDDFKVDIIASGSSALALQDGIDYLARRCKIIHVPPLQFREFLHIKYRKKVKTYGIDDILSRPQEILAELLREIPTLEEDFRFYLREGGLPIVFDRGYYIGHYFQIVNRILTYDLLYTPLSRKSLLRAKDVVAYLARIPPSDVNIENAARLLDLPKGSLYNLLNILEGAGLIHRVEPFTERAKVVYRKQPKIYFAHPSLRHSILTDMALPENLGAYREEFFYFAMRAFGPKYVKGRRKNPDFQVGKRTFEIGGPYKKEVKNIITVKDSLDANHPLILFGFIDRSKN